MNSLIKLITSFDQDNHTRGVQFEKLCKWILENHPLYKPKLKKVWLWDDWPDRWGRDCGIDLVAEDVDGKTWAVQAKCYDPKNSVTKKDIDSFLSESANSKIHHRLLIATTDGIGANARAVIGRQNDTISFSQMMLSNLLEAPLEWPKSIHELSTATVKKRFKPKPYQQKAIGNVVQNLDRRGQLIMACGTGKTLTGLWINEKLNSNLTLVLLPSLLLLSKTLTEWLTHCKKPFSYLPVCSDDTVAKSEDAINLSTAELSFPTTTNADDIAKFVQGTGRKVIFSTYQSSEKIAEAFKSYNLKAIDLVIADEAHRCAGKADSAYSTVLDNQQLPAAKRLFMTATPRIFQSAFKKKASDSGVEVMSMDDEAVFGPVLHKLSFGEAIEQDLLSDYQVVIVGIDNPSYLAMITDRTLVKTSTDIQSDAQSFASHIGLAKAVKNYHLTRVISFHSRVSSARDFANKLPEVINWMPIEAKPDGELLTNHVSGAMPTNERNKNLQALGNIADNQRYILSNARCLSEGVDVPALDGVAFIDPKNSEIDIIQAVGRAIRLSKGKAIGSIVIPVFIEGHEDPDEVLNSSPFKKVWAVVNALRSHDEGLGEELDRLRQDIGKRGTVGKSDKIVFDLPKTISQSFEKALKTKLVVSSTCSTEFWLGLLEKYFEQKGHCNVKNNEVFEGAKLGYWVGHTRNSQHLLNENHIKELNKMGFIWDVHDHLWEFNFKALKLFKLLFGHVRVPYNFPTVGFKLGWWVTTQRTSKNELSAARIAKLNSLGFVWSLKDYQWETAFELLEQFKFENGHCKVPQKLVLDGFKLGQWVSGQRKNYKKGNLSPDKLQKLNQIGFDADKIEAVWEENFNRLIRYKAKTGHCFIGFRDTFEGELLGRWVYYTIRRQLNGKLDPIKKKRLEDVGLIFAKKLDLQWLQSFGLLRNYYTENGNCLVPYRLKVGEVNLGAWVKTQHLKKDKLSSERLELLNSLGFFNN